MTGFVKATRQKAALKLAITGPSGSGKTYSALLLAFGLGKKVAVIDTENHSASLYADLGDYDVLVIEPPFSTTKYIDGIKAAEAGGYEVLVVDSLTHAWAGEGGILDQKNARDTRGGNQYTNWKEPGEAHERLKNAILQSPLHVIATMRSKVEYVIEGNKPVKKGFAPIQRDGMEYEFTTVFDLDMSHNALASKDRTNLFDAEVTRISQKTGERLILWLNSASAPVASPLPVEQPATDDQRRRINTKRIKLGLGAIDLSDITTAEQAKATMNELLALEKQQKETEQAA